MSKAHPKTDPQQIERAENGDFGLQRNPSKRPSRDDRVATIELGDYRVIVGYRWAVYACITPDGKMIVFRGWKNFSPDTCGSITALEAAAADSVPGAPAIALPPRDSDENISLSDGVLYVRTKSSRVPDYFPNEHLVFVVNHNDVPDTETSS